MNIVHEKIIEANKHSTITDEKKTFIKLMHILRKSFPGGNQTCNFLIASEIPLTKEL